MASSPGINLYLRKEDEDGHTCPVCKIAILNKETSVIAYRLPPHIYAFELGVEVVYHHLATLVCCGVDCASRVAPSWSGEKRSEHRKELIAKIKMDIDSRKRKINEYLEPEQTSPLKRLTKDQYKTLEKEALKNKTMVRMN